MSDQASTLVETQAADEEICKEEIAQMGKLKTQKDWIIKQAAIKLENSGKYDDDLAEIGNRIHKLWKDHISKSYVYKVLDDKYKRAYEKPEDFIAADEVEEALERIAGIGSALSAIATDLIKKKRDKPEVAKVLSEEWLKFESADLVELANQLSTIGQFSEFIDFIKEIEVNIDFIKECIDWRQKLNAFNKAMLKMMFTEELLAHVADQIGYSSKWMSAIEKDNELDNLINKLECCPRCNSVAYQKVF